MASTRWPITWRAAPSSLLAGRFRPWFLWRAPGFLRWQMMSPGLIMLGNSLWGGATVIGDIWKIYRIRGEITPWNGAHLILFRLVGLGADDCLSWPNEQVNFRGEYLIAVGWYWSSHQAGLSGQESQENAYHKITDGYEGWRGLVFNPLRMDRAWHDVSHGYSILQYTITRNSRPKSMRMRQIRARLPKHANRKMHCGQSVNVYVRRCCAVTHFAHSRIGTLYT
jgi:hypothetical protein